MQGVVIKIKKNKLEEWKKWCNEIQTKYRKEAIKTLHEEKCTQELFSIFQINDDWYTIGMSEGECLPSNKQTELNRLHEQKKQRCLESQHVSRAEVLYHIKSY
jgi:hypothetical protein